MQGRAAVASLLVLGAACFVAKLYPAEATTYFQSSPLCQKVLNTTGTPYLDDIGRMQNTSSTNALLLSCPVAQVESTTVDVDGFYVYYSETNTGSDVFDDYYFCKLIMRTANSTTYVSAAMYTCNTVGGCSSPNSADSPGIGYLQWGNVFSSQSNIRFTGIYCNVCEASPGQCEIRDYGVTLAGS